MIDFTINDLRTRLFRFSVNILLLVRKLPKSTEYQVIRYQLIKSSTSTGANYEEAQAAVSRSDFANKIGISLKEIRESNYWIRLIIAVDDINQEWFEMQKESSELMRILGSIYSKSSVKR
jgi:four helix bundle protein